MNKLKQAVNNISLNEDKILQSILSKEDKPSLFNFKWMVPVLSLAMLLMIFFNTQPLQQNPILEGILSPNQVLAYAVVSVDVNPSFEFYTDMEQKVVDFKLNNNEATQFDTQTWLGQTITSVIDDVIRQAILLGYMNIQDTLNDAIVVSSVSYGVDNQVLLNNVQTELKLNTNIDRSVKTYVLEATQDDYEEAEVQNMSLGLYLVNRTISVNGEMTSIQSFIQNETYMDQLEELAEHQTSDDLIEIIQVLIDELKIMSIDTTNFEQRLNNPNEDLEELVEDIKDLFHQEDEEDEHEEDQITNNESNTENSTESNSNESSDNDDDEEDEHAEEEDD